MQSNTKSYLIKRITVENDLEIAYYDEGDGPVLLFVHGLASYLHAWQKNFLGLKNQFRCIALDLPNFGQSGKGDFPCDMSFYSQVILAFIERLKIKEYTLVGHSMGGQISLSVALKKPSGLKRLILVAPAGFEQFTDMEIQWFRTFYKPVFIKTMKIDQIRKNFELNFSNLSEDMEFMFKDRLALMEDERAFSIYCQTIPKCVLGMLQEPVFKHLSQISYPTLVIFGEQDKLIPNQLLHKRLTTREVAEEGYSQISDCTLKLIPESGHFVQFEKADQVNALIRQSVSQERTAPVTDLEVIQQFFKSFAASDPKGMANCYGENIQFEDPVFGQLEGEQVKAMWFMLLSNKESNLQINYGTPKPIDPEKFICSWEATYIFSQTRNKIHNKVKSTFWLKGGKIIRQRDQFNFWSWASQAFGTSGLLMGGLPLFKNKVRQGARKALQRFMEKAGGYS